MDVGRHCERNEVKRGNLKEDRDMSFEESLKSLQRIIEKLEDKNTTLDEGIAQFEKGVIITRDCLEIINAGMGKVSLLQKDMDRLIEKPFNNE